MKAALEAKEIYQQAAAELRAQIAELRTKVDEQAALLANRGTGRILAIAEIRDNALSYASAGTTYATDGNDGVLTFDNAKNLKFVTLLTDVALGVGFITNTHIVSSSGPTYVRFRHKALDTGDRIGPPQNVSVAIVAFD